jgi:hypothetical protein
MEEIIKKIEAAKKEAFDLIPVMESNLLDDEKRTKLAELTADLSDSFKKRETGRPKYLMEVSVLKDTKFPTTDSKYWQCTLERDIQFQNLLFTACDFKEKTGELMEIESELEADGLSPGQQMKLDALRMRLLLQLMFMRKEADDRCREIFAWTSLIKQLEPVLKYPKDDPEAYMPESFLIKMAEQQKIIEQIGAADMSGAINIVGLGQAASKYWKEKKDLYTNK